MKLSALERQDLRVLARDQPTLGSWVRRVQRRGLVDVETYPVLTREDLDATWALIPVGCKLMFLDAVSLFLLQVLAARPGCERRIPDDVRALDLMLISGEDTSRPAVRRGA